MAVTKKYDEDGKYPKGDINKVARMLNMSDEGIRIYQKKGLVFPAIKAESRIRSFDIMDFTMLLYSRSYRKCDFSLVEVETIVNDCNIEQIRRMYEEKKLEKENEIHQAQLILRHIHDTIESINRIPELLGKIEISNFPGLFRLEFMYSGDVWNLDSEMVSNVSEWAGYAPCTAISTRYSIVACDKAIHTILAADNTQLIPDMKVLIDYLRDNSLQPITDAVTLGIVSTNYDTTFTRYFHLWIPLYE